jgi:predicted nucleic acid-binding protein
VAEPVVIDASVAAKWFLVDATEADVDLADDVLIAILAGEVDAHAPGIFRHEVCSLLAKAIGHRRLTATQAVDCALAFFAVPVSVHGDNETNLRSAIRLAAQHSRTFYDMTYVLLAIDLACRWCTADTKFLRDVPPAIAPQVEALSSLR